MGESDARDLYAVLGVPADADDDTIHAAYRAKAQQYHPDKVRHLGPEFRALAEQRMREINDAYDVLRDAARRRDYDMRRDGSPSAPVSDSPPDGSAPSSPRSSRVFWMLLGALLAVGIVGAGLIRWRVEARTDGAIRVHATFERAQEYYANSRWQEAVWMLQRVTKERPDSLKAWNMRWRSEQALGLYADAARSLERAVQLAPSDVLLRAELARVQFARGEDADVRAELLWLRENGQADRVAALIREFRAQSPARTQRLLDADRSGEP